MEIIKEFVIHSRDKLNQRPCLFFLSRLIQHFNDIFSSIIKSFKFYTLMQHITHQVYIMQTLCYVNLGSHGHLLCDILQCNEI